jgi:phosphoserine phosphatase
MKDLIIIGPNLEAAADSWLVRSNAEIASLPAPDLLRLTRCSGEPNLIETAHDLGCDAFFLDPVLRLSDFKVLAMDMDSTLITIECIDEIADLAGVKPAVAAVTAAAMRGELDFPSALRQRVALLKGLPVTALAEVYEKRLQLSPGAETLLTLARTVGWTTVLVSGGFTYFTERLQQRLQLDHTLANTLGIENGHLTGEVFGDIVDAQAKAARVKSVCDSLGCPTSQAIVIGDGANDLAMMRLSGLSVAYKAKPVVRREATLSIQHSGLDALFYRFTL